MMKAGIVTLIGESPEARGVLDEKTESTRDVYCTVRSVGQSEIYQARATGLSPELKLILAHDFEYQGEALCEVDSVRYSILRTYVTETDGIELTLERVRGNAAEEVQPTNNGDTGAQGEPAETGGTAEDEPATGGEGA